MNIADWIELVVLTVWALVIAGLALTHKDISMATATAFSAYVSAVAIKITWGA